MIGFEEVAAPDAQAASLFFRSFNAPAPDIPRHFVARLPDRAVCGYVHLTPIEPEVFLVGGLCVDKDAYRRMSAENRQEVAGHGSLSRWLLEQSIHIAGSKRAVFAYTGNVMSRRDCEALGFVAAAGPYLLVQWHAQPEGQRRELIEKIAGLGPF
ncbi:hypothetical protein DSM104443_00510 [Usitatibacter rugosus]|uniref:Uncharacterized protein n=1 Tax=Usitatibacter rugosus TaxID=2732067 RepID=A0A6M4GQX1_9PROT|nr:hypothetical protein [Usitatibacter rugosus]QJR09466.1 hypothetical protein DSM104443_00510 [Usitatibacter rugosus]